MEAFQMAAIALGCTAIIFTDLEAIRRLLQNLLQELKEQRK